MLVSVDLGFGYTKAVSANKKVILPSVIAPTEDNNIEGLTRIGYTAELKKPGETKKVRLAVGEQAVKEGRAIQLSLDSQKFNQESSVFLALTASYLVGAEGHVELAIGLPISTYRDKKYREEVVNTFSKVNSYVQVDNGPEKYISFTKVRCYPQGVGAVYSLDSLPANGLVGLLDIGFFTTDLVLFECASDRIIPLSKYFRSLPIGVSRAIQLFADAFAEQTGTAMTLVKALEIWNMQSVTFKGKAVDIAPMIVEARDFAGKALGTAVNDAWVEKIEWLDHVMLAGGGALEIGASIKDILKQAVVVDDPQFANAIGFYRLMDSELARENKAV